MLCLVKTFSYFFFIVLTLHLALLAFCSNASEDLTSLLIVVRSQTNEYHRRVAQATEADLNAQIIDKHLNAKVVLMHDEWPVESAWTVLPVIPGIMRKYSNDYQWVMFIEETTKVDVNAVITKLLPNHNSQDEKVLCRCLHDNEPSIIHHFAFFDGSVKKFNFPDFDAGWILSSAIVKRIGLEWDTDKISSDFQIDVKHEIAMFLDKTHNVKMTCVKELCGGGETGHQCVTSFNPSLPECGTKTSLDNVLFSVKTTLKFHKNRIDVVKKTWAKYVKNIRYYSNVTDSSIPTLDCGVPNTNQGHCGKMEAIINDFDDQKSLQVFDWLVIADDDSIIGVSRLIKLLNCYDPSLSVVLGERYGFGLLSGRGYGYITGGGGMVMSRGAVNAWEKHGCTCPSISTPDDMYLGMCFSAQVGVPVTHSPLFHQARPVDYADGYLGNQKPISFHKHWEIDPIKVYKTWFEEDDESTYGEKSAFAPTPPPESQPVPLPPTPLEVPVKDEL